MLLVCSAEGGKNHASTSATPPYKPTTTFLSYVQLAQILRLFSIIAILFTITKGLQFINIMGEKKKNK